MLTAAELRKLYENVARRSKPDASFVHPDVYRARVVCPYWNPEGAHPDHIHGPLCGPIDREKPS